MWPFAWVFVEFAVFHCLVEIVGPDRADRYGRPVMWAFNTLAFAGVLGLAWLLSTLGPDQPPDPRPR
jgi:hypothetical protein